jgi:hypothetical protein
VSHVPVTAALIPCRQVARPAAPQAVPAASLRKAGRLIFHGSDPAISRKLIRIGGINPAAILIADSFA